MATATRRNHETYDGPDNTDSDQHHAIVEMIELAERGQEEEDGNHSRVFIHTMMRLDASPAFREFAEVRGLDTSTAADMMIAGMFYARRVMDRAFATYSDVCKACDR